MQLSPESGNVRSPLPDSREHVWPDSAKMVGFRLDSSGSGQARPNPGHFGQTRPDQLPDPSRPGLISCRILPNPTGFQPFWPNPVGSVARSSQNGRIPASFDRNLVRRYPATVAECRRISAPSVFQWSDVAGFRRRLDSDN
jgi:hypothetical protein